MMKSLSLSDGVAGAEGARRATGDPATGADGSVPRDAVPGMDKAMRYHGSLSGSCKDGCAYCSPFCHTT